MILIYRRNENAESPAAFRCGYFFFRYPKALVKEKVHYCLVCLLHRVFRCCLHYYALTVSRFSLYAFALPVLLLAFPAFGAESDPLTVGDMERMTQEMGAIIASSIGALSFFIGWAVGSRT